MRRENIETVCRLSPLQEGLLFHSVKDPGSTAYVNQHHLTLEGDIDEVSFRRAWEIVVERHQILRTTFHWEGFKQPVQVVNRSVPVDIEFADWRKESESRQTERFATTADSERMRGLDLAKAPLFRVFMARLSDTLYRLCWTYHHLILDGWSGALVAKELFLSWDSIRAGTASRLPAPGKFTDFVNWLVAQDRNAARSYWTRSLAGFSQATPLPYLGPGTQVGQMRRDHALPTELTRALRSSLASKGFTLSTLCNAAWAITLARHAGVDDVVFGVTTSGRPPDLPDIECTAGLFINTLPLRVQRTSGDTAASFMQRVQDRMLDLQTFEYSHLAEVQTWAGVAPLFESLMVVETYPVESVVRSGLKNLRIREVSIAEHTNYPLSIIIGDEDRTNIAFAWNAKYFDPTQIERLMNEFVGAMKDLAFAGDGPLPPVAGVNKVATVAVKSKHSFASESSSTTVWTATEELVRELWSEVLDITPLDRNQSFFDLGGHSIQALRIIGRLRSKTSADIPLQALFDHPSIAGLAAVVDRASAQSRFPEISRLREDLADVPLSFAQERMWLMHQRTPDSSAYNIPLVIEIDGALHVDALREMLRRLVERHEPLRSIVRERSGGLRQYMLPSSEVPFEFTDISDGSEESADRIAQREAHLPFELDSSPPVRARLIKLGDTRYLFCLTLHHIAADEWSMRVLLREAVALYEAISSGNDAQLEPLPVRFADYAHWQRQLYDPGQHEGHLAYWTQQLRDAEGSLDLPADQNGSGAPERNAGRATHAIESSVWTDLLATTSARGITPFMFMVAVYAATLLRWSGRREICIGTPFDERTRPELESLVGLFVNTLVLRIRTQAGTTLGEILDQTRRTVLDAHLHSEVPFDAVVNALRTELFETIFVIQTPVGPPAMQAGEVTFRARPPMETAPKVPLMLTVTERPGGGAECAWEFDRARLAEQTVERISLVYVRLLNRFLQGPHCRLADVDIVGEDERARINAWGRGSLQSRSACTIQGAIRERADLHPNAPALESGADVWTYAKLVAESERIAGALAADDVRFGDIVAICEHRSAETIAALLGILTCGAAYLPLDPEDPPSRIAAVTNESRAVKVLTPGEIRRRFFAGNSSDDYSRLSQTQAGIAYVMYTSGSTGKPKGVMVSHDSVLRLADGLDDFIDLEEKRVVHAAPLAFDASVFEIWAALIRGACVVVSPGPLKDLPGLSQLIASSGADTVWLTASLFNLMVETGIEDLAGVEQLLIGGEALSVPHVRKYRHRFPHTKLVNGYGPTENTTFTSCYQIPACLAEDLPSIPIGRPVGATRVYVLDEQLHMVPTGAVGELYTSGDGLALGYVNDASQTAERFLPDLFAQDSGARMYRTGDLARWHHDGVLEYRGRTDRQMKIHGHRIECAEVEQLLRSYPNIEDAAVRITTASSGGKTLVAYCVPRESHDIDVTRLQCWMSARAPRYMIPGMVVTLDRLPRNTNGKVEYRNLPDPHLGVHASIEPRTSGERKLLAVWRKVLNNESIGVEDDFYASGGDSLLALRLCIKAAEAGLALTLRDILDGRTVASAARAAEERSTKHALPDAPGRIPLSPSQQFVLASKHTPPNHYNIGALVDVAVRIDDAAWRRIVIALANRHDSLRLRIRQIEAGWSAEVEPELLMAPFERVNLAGLTPDEQERRMTAEAERAQRSLSLADGRVFAVVLFQLGPERNDRLLAVVHHLAADGASLSILLSSLESLLLAQPASLEPGCTWARWSRTLEEMAGSEKCREDIEYWTSPERLKYCALPRDLSGENLESTVDEVVTEFEAPEGIRSELPAVLLSAVAIAIGEWAETPILNLDWIWHGREGLDFGADISRTVGYFSSRVPIVLKYPTVRSVATLLPAVQKTIQAVPNRGITYGVLRYLSPDEATRAALERIPQPEVSFNYLGDLEIVHSKDRILAPVDTPVGPAREGSLKRAQLLQIFASLHAGKIQLLWRYSRAVHARTTIERVAGAAERAVAEFSKTRADVGA